MKIRIAKIKLDTDTTKHAKKIHPQLSRSCYTLVDRLLGLDNIVKVVVDFRVLIYRLISVETDHAAIRILLIFLRLPLFFGSK